VIANLITKSLRQFIGGRVTTDNPAEIGARYLETAKNVLLHGDGAIHKRNGYSLVTTPFAARVRTIIDFHRATDGRQLLIVGGGGRLGYLDPSAAYGYTELSAAEDADAKWRGISTLHTAYLVNGIKAKKLVNKVGVETLYDLGIDAPATAPTLVVNAGGSLNLDLGRQYCVAFVSYWTDDQGVQRYHIGPPSAFSGHTGKVANGIPTLSNIPVSADPQVTHKWIFAPADSDPDSTDVYYFAAEITNATTTWADTIDDDDLDDTRLAPFDNQPPPDGASVVVEFANRMILGGFTDDPDLVVASAFEECDLGITYESFPLDLRYRVPGGIKRLVGMAVGNESLVIGTEDFWFMVRGYDAETFEKRDRVISPGPISPDAICVWGGWLLWLAKDKHLYAWDFASAKPEMISAVIAAEMDDELGVESISTAQREKAELAVYTNGRSKFIMLSVATTAQDGTGKKDWIQMWDVTPFLDGTSGPAECDFFPSHLMDAMALIDVNGEPFVFMGDESGNIYRWPDGYTDAGNVFPAVASTITTDSDDQMKKRWHWIDLITDRLNAWDHFGIAVFISDGVKRFGRMPQGLPMRPLPSNEEKNPGAARGMMRERGVTYGKYCRTTIIFPLDDQPASVSEVKLNYSPVGAHT